MGNGCCQAKNMDKDSETVFKIAPAPSTGQNGSVNAESSTKGDLGVTASAPQAIKSDYTPLTATKHGAQAEPARVISNPANVAFTTGYTAYANPTGGYYYPPTAHVVQTSLPQGQIYTSAVGGTTTTAHTQSYNPLQQRGLLSSGQKGLV